MNSNAAIPVAKATPALRVLPEPGRGRPAIPQRLAPEMLAELSAAVLLPLRRAVRDAHRPGPVPRSSRP